MAVTKLLIHAPTVDALKRAQNNARNLLQYLAHQQAKGWSYIRA